MFDSLRSTVPALSLLALAAALGGCDRSSSGIKGSGNLTSENRTVSGFTQVTLATVGTVVLSQNGNEALSIEAEDNLLPHLTSTVKDGRLTLGTDASFEPTKPIRYTVSVKSLSGLEVSGAGRITASKIETPSLTTKVSGLGAVTVSGRAQSEDVSIDGAGSYDGAQLAAKTVKASINGAGGAGVSAAETLDVRIDGAGWVEYTGDAKVTQNVSGLGSVRRKAVTGGTIP